MTGVMGFMHYTEWVDKTGLYFDKNKKLSYR